MSEEAYSGLHTDVRDLQLFYLCHSAGLLLRTFLYRRPPSHPRRIETHQHLLEAAGSNLRPTKQGPSLARDVGAPPPFPHVGGLRC